MMNLHPLELDRLKLMLSASPKRTLTTEEKISTLNILRSELPNLFSGLTEEQLKDNNFLIKFLSNPYNRNKIKTALKEELSPTQQAELIQALDKETVEGQEMVGQYGGQETGQANQEAPIQSGGTGPSGMPFGIPSGSGISFSRSAPRINPKTPEAQKPDIAIANSNGHVTEAGDPSKLVTANSSGAIKEAGEPSKLVLTRSDGSIIKAPTANPAIHIADKSGNIIKTYNVRSPSWLKSFGSNTQIFAKKNLGRIADGLTHSALPTGANFLGRTGLGASDRLLNARSRILNTGTKLSRNLKGAKSKFSSGGGKKAALAFAGVFFLIFIMGAVGGTTPTGEAAPLPPSGTSSDISQCKFIRGGDSVKELTYKSPLLLSYIQEASNLTNIPPAVLAAFIRVESASALSFSDEQVRNYQCIRTGPGTNVSASGALGVMQLQPDGTTGNDQTAVGNGAKLIGKEYSQLTEADYCDVRKNIIMGAGFILMKMSYKTKEYPATYGDGTKWDSAWTSNRQAIDKLVNGYYGCLKYPSCSSGPFNYGTDVSTSIQNCQSTGGGSVPPPPANGDYAGWVKNNFNVDVSTLPAPYPQWAQEILSTSVSAAPKFKNLISASLTKVILAPNNDGSHTSGDTVFIRSGYDVNFFKQIFIHELGHRIKGTAGTASPSCNGQNIEQSETEGYLTYYAEHATPAQVKSPACGNNDQATRSDEDFGESVSYYINNMGELNYGSGCSTYNSINPYTRSDRPAHKAYIQCLLGP